MARKVLQAGLWWPMVHMDNKAFVKKCDVCQRTRCPSHRDELPLHPIKALQPFEKWEIDFIGPIAPIARHSQARYIITTIDYLKRCEEVMPVKNYTAETTARFIF